jgi:hypothetical protein
MANEIAAAVMKGLMNQVNTEIILMARSTGLILPRQDMSKSFEILPRLHLFL